MDSMFFLNIRNSVKGTQTPHFFKAKASFALDFPDLGGKIQHIFEINRHDWKYSTVTTRKRAVYNSELCLKRKRTGHQDYTTEKE